MIFALLLCVEVQGTALAVERYACGAKLHGYNKADFVVLTGTDVNFRTAPVDGKVLRLLPRHTLMRVLATEGAWYKVNLDGTIGYVHGDFTGKGHQDPLSEEDFVIGEIALGAKFDADAAVDSFGRLRKTSKKSDRIYYAYKGVTFGVSKHGKHVDYIELTNDANLTMRGVCVDDSGALVVGQYGVPDGVVYDDDITAYEYFSPENREKKLTLVLNRKSQVEKIILERK